jgi:branched-chain amino acid transport system permease protein
VTVNRKLSSSAALGGSIALLVLLPVYASAYTLTTSIRIIYFGFLALSVGFLIAQTGMVSLCQTALFGTAGYAIGLLGKEQGIPFPWCALIALGLVLLLALIFGLVAMRTHGIVFMMITLAFGQICWAFAQQNTSLLHGWAGIRGIRPPAILGLDLRSPANFYWFALTLFVGSSVLLWCLSRSSFGLALNGIRESPRRMAALGYRVYWLRIISFLVAAACAGIGGLLATYNTGIITPTTIQLSRTIWILLLVILGGSAYFFGPILGTVIGVTLDVLISQHTERYNTVIGVIFVLTILLFPRGILSIFVSGPRAKVANGQPAEPLISIPEQNKTQTRSKSSIPQKKN